MKKKKNKDLPNISRIRRENFQGKMARRTFADRVNKYGLEIAMKLPPAQIGGDYKRLADIAREM